MPLSAQAARLRTGAPDGLPGAEIPRTRLIRYDPGRTRGEGGTIVETSLYPPIKRFLEARGFAVKGEIGGCDLVAIDDGSPPVVVIGELKLRFNLELVLQAVDRAAACDEVWIAARIGSGRTAGRDADPRFRALCRRLGFGMLGVTTADDVVVLLSPTAPMPRRDPRRRSRLVAEHQRRVGDPAAGGSSRVPVMTAYRQRALLCAAAMAAGLSRPRDLRETAPDAATILGRNVYGWFERVERGRYALTAAGQAALRRWPQGATTSPPAG